MTKLFRHNNDEQRSKHRLINFHVLHGFLLRVEPFRTVHMLFPRKSDVEQKEMKEALLAGYVLVSVQNYISYYEL